VPDEEVPQPAPITASKLVLVEGWDEYGVVKCLIEKWGLTDIEVRCLDGETDWPRQVRMVTGASGFRGVRSILMIRDANSAPEAKFRSTGNALSSAGLTVPQQPEVFADGAPRVAIFISPGETRTGEFDDLLLEILSQSPVVPCIDAFEQCLNEHAIPVPKKRSKMRLQLHLAAHPRVFRTAAIACTGNMFDPTHPALSRLRQLLQAL